MEMEKQEKARRMLFEWKKSALGSSRSGMRRLLSGENREIFGAGLEKGDLSVAVLVQTMQCMLLDSRWDLIKKIDHALTRLREGTYGICDECNCEIGEKRLSIVPFTPYCRDCQETKEQSAASRR